jgi:hypothetical protein
MILVFAAGVLLAVVAMIFCPLVRLALSRRRESLADVSGVELTRNPAGLISALRKLEANDVPLAKLSHATAPMCIVDPLQHHESWFHRLFDTHLRSRNGSPSSNRSNRGGPPECSPFSELATPPRTGSSDSNCASYLRPSRNNCFRRTALDRLAVALVSTCLRLGAPGVGASYRPTRDQ